MGYISVDYFKQRNPTLDLSQYSDTTLSGMIETASTQVDNYLNYTLELEDIVSEKIEGFVDGDSNLKIYPLKRPINTVSAISLVKGTDVIDLTLQDNLGVLKYDIPTTKEVIVYPDNEIAFNSVSIIDSFFSLRNTKFFTRISYNAGYQTIPQDIQDATSLFVKEQVARGFNITGATSIRQGGISMSYGSRSGSDNKVADSDNVADAKSLLVKYKRVTPF